MTAEQSAIQVLLVEDDPAQRLLVGDLLSQQGYHVQRAAGLEEARRALSEPNLQLVISDFRLADGDGLVLLREVRASRRVEFRAGHGIRQCRACGAGDPGRCR